MRHKIIGWCLLGFLSIGGSTLLTLAEFFSRVLTAIIFSVVVSSLIFLGIWLILNEDSV